MADAEVVYLWHEAPVPSRLVLGGQVVADCMDSFDRVWDTAKP
jgi:hypothetical protein